MQHEGIFVQKFKNMIAIDVGWNFFIEVLLCILYEDICKWITKKLMFLGVHY